MRLAKPILTRPRPVPGKKSAVCAKATSHGQCTMLSCSCECHKREPETKGARGVFAR